MKCKYCQSELEEGVTLCPACGKENSEPAKTGLGAGKIALLVILAVAAIAVIAALVMGGGNGAAPAGTTEPIATTTPAETTPATTAPAPTIPADGNPDDVTCKGTYTVTDEEMIAAASAVVATMGDAQLSNEELQVYYWMQVIDFLNNYGSYADMMGLDITQPLDTQVSMGGAATWQQYFLEAALESWTNYQAMAADAQENGYVLDEEYANYLKELPASLEEQAKQMGFETVDAMIQADMGPGASMEAYLKYLNTYYVGYMYYGDTLEQIAITDADVEAYFDAHAEEYKANGLEKSDECYVDVRHILIQPESAAGDGTFTDEEWAAAESKANDVLNQWLSKDPTEESFSAMAKTHSTDPGSASNGGLYENVYVGQMVPEFEGWCFDASRQYGDYGIVKTTYGYHIMYFVGSTPKWYASAESDLMAEKGSEILNKVLEKHPAQIDYSAIALGNVGLTAAN